MLVCIFFLLNQVDGKMFRLKTFLMERNFSLIDNEGLIRFVNFTLSGLIWISLVLPLLGLGVWSAGLIIRAQDLNDVPIGGICVILVGIAFIFFTFGILMIKWNNYRFRFVNGFCIVTALALMTAYQYVVVFLD